MRAPVAQSPAGINTFSQNAHLFLTRHRRVRYLFGYYHVEASVGGGKVKVEANGSGEIISIYIDPSVVDPSDVEFLQELVLSGVQEAITKGKEMAASEMSKLTGGLNIPGM